jgi:hypothetical protein
MVTEMHEQQPPADPPRAFDLSETMELLARTPPVLEALLGMRADGWLHADEGPDTWSPIGVLGHMVHGEETDWIPRARIILEEGGARPFEPFDRLAHLERFRGWGIDALLRRFAQLREQNLGTLAAWRLSEEQLELPGRHPTLGPVTLRQLLATWAVHDMSHLAQISRVMAKRYAAEVGPWAEFLSVLRR